MARKNRTAGFSLIEVLIAIVILGLTIVPVCGSLVTTFRVNARGDALLNAQLAVSAKVEELMAAGYDPTKDYDTETVKVTATPVHEDSEDETSRVMYYNVTVTGRIVDFSESEDDVVVTTKIRRAAAPEEEGGG